jgi:hypothetical protein
MTVGVERIDEFGAFTSAGHDGASSIKSSFTFSPHSYISFLITER